MSSKNQNAEQKAFWKKSLETSISLVLAFLFSIGIIGGSSYLLFDRQKDLLGFEQYELVFKNAGAKASLGCQICELNKNGWFSKPENQERALAIFQELKANKQKERLEPGFAIDSLRWFADAIAQLSSEQGRISGFVSDDELSRKYQEVILNNYELQMQVIKEMELMIKDWENQTEVDRDNHINGIQSTILNLTASFQSFLSVSEQMMMDSDRKIIELEQSFNEFNEIYRIIRVKLFLSVTGIVIGGIVFIWISYKAVKLYTGNSKSSGQRTQRRPQKGSNK